MDEIKNMEHAAKLMEIAHDLIPQTEETRALRMQIAAARGIAGGIIWRATSPESEFFLHDLDSPQGL